MEEGKGFSRWEGSAREVPEDEVARRQHFEDHLYGTDHYNTASNDCPMLIYD